VSVPSGFILDVDLPTSLAPGASDTFTVRLATTSAGSKSGQISFSNNDSDENPFNFSITGNVTAPPTVTINQAAGQSDPTGNSSINFTVVFSEVVTGFGSSDVTLGGTAGATGKTVTGSGTTYNVAVSGMTQSGTVTATIPAGAAQDGAGNSSLASTSGDNSVTYNVPPQTGSMQVSLAPAGAVSAGAQWQVDGGAWQISVATVSGLSVGSHPVTFKTVSGWTTPGNQNVTVNANQTTTATGTYVVIPQTGSLQVNLAPAGAVSAGAQWQVDGGAWQNSGATVSGLSVGNHPVTFNTLSGWTTPGNQSVTVNANQTTTATGTYVVIPQIGSLQVTIGPAGAVSAGAQWQVDGGAWQNSGATVSGLSVGNHPVVFNTVSGWTTPGNQNVTVNANQTTPATGTYVAIPEPPKQLTGMTLSNGVFRFVLNGPVGSNFVIQISSNLVNWLPLVTNVIPASGSVLITDPVIGQPTRFYRAVGGNTSVAPNNMALIPAGSFTMGDTFSEGYSDELPLHSVYVSAFYMDQYEVTKALWDDVYNWAIMHGYSFDNAGSGKAANHPVQTIDWYDCVKWCNARSEKENKAPAYYTDAGLSVPYRTGQVAPYVNWSSGYRLPTEAEWEKAARGGAGGQRFPWGNTISWSQANYYAYPLSAGGYAYDINPTAGYHPKFNDGVTPYTSPVGYFAPNGYGLYDMAGNVWEWCWDWYSSIYYSSSPGTDPRGSAPGSNRVDRGGGWGYYAIGCRAASRDRNYPSYGNYDVGFRSVLSPGQ